MTGTKKRFQLKISFTFFISIFLAIAPILDPYVFLEIGSGITIKLMDVFLILMGVLCFCKSTFLDGKFDFCIKWIIPFFILSILALGLPANASLSLGVTLKNLIIELVYAVLFAYIWKTPCRNMFFKCVECLCIISAIVVIYQFIMGNIGTVAWDGKIPFLNLATGEHWSGYIDVNTFDVRPNGIFQEASYAGIYLMIGYISAMKNNKFLKAMVIAVAMCCTASLVSIVGLLLITLYVIMKNRQLGIENRSMYKLIAIVVCAVILIVILSLKNASVGSLVHYLQKRVLSISTDLNSERMGSTRYRLTGFIGKFPEYSFTQKLIGVGASQFANYFNVFSYSNVFVTLILDHGLVGVFTFIVLLKNLYKRIARENKIFFYIFVLIMAVDYSWYNYTFFFLLTACIILPEKNRNKSIVLSSGII